MVPAVDAPVATPASTCSAAAAAVPPPPPPPAAGAAAIAAAAATSATEEEDATITVADLRGMPTRVLKVLCRGNSWKHF
nr:unnamed protein product [Digitaria exilis]